MNSAFNIDRQSFKENPVDCLRKMTSKTFTISGLIVFNRNFLKAIPCHDFLIKSNLQTLLAIIRLLSVLYETYRRLVGISCC